MEKPIKMLILAVFQCIFPFFADLLGSGREKLSAYPVEWVFVTVFLRVHPEHYGGQVETTWIAYNICNETNMIFNSY